MYLEALHQPENIARGYLTKEHTVLLLNSYARLGDKERIDNFLDVSLFTRFYCFRVAFLIPLFSFVATG